LKITYQGEYKKQQYLWNADFHTTTSLWKPITKNAKPTAATVGATTTGLINLQVIVIYMSTYDKIQYAWIVDTQSGRPQK
jgi:hypothetical protein